MRGDVQCDPNDPYSPVPWIHRQPLTPVPSTRFPQGRERADLLRGRVRLLILCTSVFVMKNQMMRVCVLCTCALSTCTFKVSSDQGRPAALLVPAHDPTVRSADRRRDQRELQCLSGFHSGSLSTRTLWFTPTLATSPSLLTGVPLKSMSSPFNVVIWPPAARTISWLPLTPQG